MRASAVVSALACAIVFGSSAAWAAPRAVIVEAMKQNGGEVEPDKVLHYMYTLRNDGDVSLVIQDLKPTCYCTTAQPEAWDVAPGASTIIHVQIDPSDFVGEIQKGVEISTNDPKNPTQLVEIDLKVRPGIAVVPAELDFGAVGPQGSKAQAVDIKSPKERPVQAKISTGAKYLAVEQEPLALEEKCGVRLQVKVLPGAPPGPFSTKIVVETGDTSRPRLEIPVHGTGPGGVSVAPAKLLFEPATAGAVVGTLEVSGGAGLKVTGVRTTSPQIEAVLEPAAGAASGGRYRIQVKLASGAKPGRLMAKVVLATSDAAQPEVTVPVTGVVR